MPTISMTAEDLEREFATRAVRRGGILFLLPLDAHELIDRARAASIRVLGVDGFHLTASTTQPDMAHSLDLSDSKPSSDVWSTASAFIDANMAAVTHFEVVLDGPSLPTSSTEYADIRLRALAMSEGGRQTPFAGRSHNGGHYMPHVRIAPGTEYLGVAFVDGPEWIQPGDEVDVTVALMYVETGVDYSPLTAGTTIQVVEGVHVVAVGTILRRWTAPGDWRSTQRHNTR